MVTGPEGRRRAVTRAASASVGNGNASFSAPHLAVGNLRVSQTECPPGYATRITNIAEPSLFPAGPRPYFSAVHSAAAVGLGFRRSVLTRIDSGSRSCRARVRASPLARPLWFGRGLGDDGRHAFEIDVESEEGQRLATGVAPLVDEAEGLVD